MADIFDLAATNLLSPVILSFVLGLVAALGRSDLSVPEAAAKAMSIYLLFANLFGFTVGPTVIALMTDIVFEDPMLIRYSLATVLPVMLLCGAGVVASGIRHYKTLLNEQASI